jgi:hypothetical protein
MADTINSANMSLPVPVVGQEVGPAYATDINNCMAIIDSHTHNPGNGVQITPNGININADLPLNLNNLTLVNSIQLSPTTIASNGTLYESGVDLYYNDGNGAVIQITESGSVKGSSGTITGLPSGTAGAAYSSGPGTFIFTSATLTPANVDAASVIIRDQTASSFGITLTAPAALAANYPIIFPGTLPGTANFISLDNSGNIAATVPVTNGITTSNISNSAGITGTQLALATVTGAQIAAGTVTIANQSSSNFNDSSIITSSTNGTTTPASFVPNLGFTVQNSNSLVYIKLIPAGANSSVNLNNTSSLRDFQVTGFVSLVVDSALTGTSIELTSDVGVLETESYTPTSIEFVTQLAAGAHTVNLRFSVDSSSAANASTISVTNCRVFVSERA